MLPFGLRVKKREGEKGTNSVCPLSTTEKRRQWASNVLEGAPGPRAGCHTEALLGPPPAFGDLASAVGDVDRLCGGILVMSRPRDGCPPRWSSLTVMMSPAFSPGTRCVGQFGGRCRKNSKFLTYSISKVEKDQTVTKINNFSIVFWWPWAQWLQQGHWRGRAPADEGSPRAGTVSSAEQGSE